MPTPRSRAEVAAYFVRHGYAVVYQDCRGRYKSGGRFTKYLSEAEDGYDTLAWLMRQPWCNGRIGTFGLSYAAHTPGGARLSRPAGIGGAVSRLRRLLERLPQRHPPRRRVRSEAGDLGLQQRARRCQGPGRQGGARSAGHQGVVRAHAVAQGRFAAQRSARLRGLPVRAVVARDFRRVLEAARDLCRRAIGSKYADVPVTHLSGWYDPYARTAVENYARAVETRARAQSADPRAVDAWRPVVDLCRRCRFRPRGGGRRQSRRGFLRLAPRLVRPLGQGRRQRRRAQSRRCRSS